MYGLTALKRDWGHGKASDLRKSLTSASSPSSSPSFSSYVSQRNTKYSWNATTHSSQDG